MPFLDSTGLTYFLGKLKLKFGTFKSVASGASKTGLQTAIYNYAFGLTDMAIMPITFSTSNSIEAPFDSTTYLGFVLKSGDRLVVYAYGISSVNEDLVGIYKGNAWTWKSEDKILQTNDISSYFTTTGLTVTIANLKAYQNGNVVLLNFDISGLTSSAGTKVTVSGFIEQGFRPKSYVSAAVCAGKDNVTSNVGVMFDSAGNFYIRHEAALSNWSGHVTVTYVIN